MPGRRSRNLREGDLAEGIGLELLRSFTAVAPVPRTEDVGVDAICTLLKPDKQFLRAENTFLIQIKAASVRTIPFHGESYEWLLQLELPVYLASVNLKSAAAKVYTMQRAVDRLDSNWRGVTIYLDSKGPDDGDDYDHGPDVRDGIHHIYLGPPILYWSAAEASTNQFRQRAYEIMKSWIEWDSANIQLRPYKCCNLPKWNTNEKPKWAYGRYGAKTEPELIQDFSHRLGTVLVALTKDCTEVEAAMLIKIIKFLRSKGFNTSEIQIAEMLLQNKMRDKGKGSKRDSVQ